MNSIVIGTISALIVVPPLWTYTAALIADVLARLPVVG